jgi:hypothetical protein
MSAMTVAKHGAAAASSWSASTFVLSTKMTLVFATHSPEPRRPLDFLQTTSDRRLMARALSLD